MYRNHEGEIIVGAECAEHYALLTKLAEARDELFGYERMVETLMINGPEYVVDEMVSEIKRLRKALGFYADASNHKAYKREAGAFHSKATGDNGHIARDALK